MSGIAEVFHNQGYQISGSDLAVGAVIEHLQGLGITFFKGHDASNVKGVDVVVISSAIRDNNCELVYAREHRIPVVPRAAMLGELMRHRHSILVAGTHGKTTTTSMLVSILVEAGVDPTFVVGGLVKQTISGARLGSSDYIVAEADESDASFLHLQPMVAVVTNIDADHLETYQGDFSQLQQTFVSFLHNLPFYGLAVLCIDDLNIRTLLNSISRPISTYGFFERADFKVVEKGIKGHQSWFTVERPEGHAPLDIEINVPGRHNMLNATAAISVATDEQIDDKSIINGLKEFKGVARRFEILGRYPVIYKHQPEEEGKDIILVDDYGHHPTEIKVTIDAIRQGFPDRRLLMIFQPHRYTRIRDLFDDFIQVLSCVDRLIITEVYGAGEYPIPRADSRSLCRSIRQLGIVDPIFIGRFEDLIDMAINIIEANDLVITQGAGSVNKLSRALRDRITAEGGTLRI